MISKRNIYFSKDDFTLYHGDSFSLLKKIELQSIDFIFADPPYFLSSGGVSCQSGKQVSVNKGEWDYSKSIVDKLKYHRKWISLCRNVLKEDPLLGNAMNNQTLFLTTPPHSVQTLFSVQKPKEP